jgi:ferric-dicitrate binding protein FerR (iron transport regulator)
VDVVEALGWTGLFVFRGETYERIAAHLARQYGVTITVSPQIASDRQTGTFDRSLGLSDILATMERSWGFTVQGDSTTGFLLGPRP